MNRNMFKMNQNKNDDDSKRLQDVVGRNQTRNFNSPFFHGDEGIAKSESSLDNGSPLGEGSSLQENSGIDSNGQVQVGGQGELPKSSLNSLVGKEVSIDKEKKGQGGKKLGGSLVGEIFGFNKAKIILISCLISFIFLFVAFLVAYMTSHSAGLVGRHLQHQFVKLFSSITNEFDYKDPKADLPAFTGDFESYFNTYIKADLIEYLKKNDYCGVDESNSECEKRDAFVFHKRFMEVTSAFESKNYPIDSSLVYETMAYYRSDEELFSGSIEKEKVVGWKAWMKSLFGGKTDEISKLANKTWREIYIRDEKGNIIGTKWVRSLDKYVAYLMYGDSMHDKSDTGTDNDLNIEAVNSTKNDEEGKVTSGSHSYKYGSCGASDSDYEGIIQQGYIYNRFKDTSLLHGKKNDEKEKAIQDIIQKIFDQIIKMHGAPSYCGGGGAGGDSGSYGSNICTYTNGKDSYNNLKIQLCECDASGLIPIAGEELVDFEKYITGVVYAENGGAPYEALKVQAVATRSYTLTRRKIDKQPDGSYILKMRNCTYDQVYCNPDKGCWSNMVGGQTHGTGDSNKAATIHSGYDASKSWSKKSISKESQIRRAVSETAGEVAVNSAGKVVNTGYVSSDQRAWNAKAEQGKDYVSILLGHYSKVKEIKKNDCKAGGKCDGKSYYGFASVGGKNMTINGGKFRVLACTADGLNNALNIISSACGPVSTAAGSFRDWGDGANASRSKTSFHYTGRALDFDTGAGMQQSTTYFYVTIDSSKSGAGHYRLYCKAKSKSEYAKNITITPVYYRGGSNWSVKKSPVTGNFVDVTAIMNENGWYGIGPRSNAGSAYMSTEWWHFQDVSGLEKDKTTFGQALRQLDKERAFGALQPYTGYKFRGSYFG